jgi:hypothetical protein
MYPAKLTCIHCGHRWKPEQPPVVEHYVGWVAAEYACPQCHQPGWQKRLDGPPQCLFDLEDGTLCGEPATTMDIERDIMVCPLHAP